MPQGFTTETLPYGEGFAGTLVIGAEAGPGSALILLAPNWLGVTPEAAARAARIAGPSGVALVVDMFGAGRACAGPPEAAPLADALRTDWQERRRRMTLALEALRDAARSRGLGDPARVAAVGFCFGGGGVLELARSGAEIAAAISLHGDLATHAPAAPGIAPALLVLHGARDPVVPKADRDAFEAEMEAAGARWQMLTFGRLVHSFAEEDAAVPGIAEYDEPAARQSYRLVADFLADAFDNRL